MVAHPGQKRKLRVAHASREFHPSEDLSELPLPGQEYHAGAVIARQIGHDLLSGRSDPLPTLLAAFMHIVCTGGSSRSLQCRCPFSIFTRHTNGCISASGYAFGKVHEKAFSGSRKKSPHYLSSFRGILIADSEKLPKTFYKIYISDKLFSRENNRGCIVPYTHLIPGYSPLPSGKIAFYASRFSSPIIFTRAIIFFTSDSSLSP